MAVAARAGEGTGLEFIQRIAAGEIGAAPIARLLGMTIEEASEGRVVFGIEPQEWHYNPIGVVHGGIGATVLDSAMGCAVQSTLPQGDAYTTLELKVNYVRALKLGTGLAKATGTVIHVGGRVATAEGRLVDGSGQLVAHATTTCLVMRAG